MSIAQVVSVCAPAWATTVVPQKPSFAYMLETRRKAYAGDPNAEVELGDWFCEGYGERVNLKLAARWYREAAKQGNNEAEQKIGEMYEFGYGVQPDHAKALGWIRKAMAQNPTSALSIAEDYDSGRRKSANKGCSHIEIVPKDPLKAVEWFRIAADSGYDRGQTLLGEMYERDPAVLNLDEALRWYRKAEDTDSRAMADLAHLYATGTGVPQDYSEAAKWYSKAVERGGYPSDQYELGLLYEEGLGVAKSRKKAMELYAAAAANGIVEAQRRLFILYEVALELPTDPNKVIAWYEAAAQAGDRRAQIGLGLHYQYGQGVPRNDDVAHALYLLAQQLTGEHGDIPRFMSPKNGAIWSGIDVALTKEMAKPGNLSKAIAEFLAQPRPEWIID